MASHQIVNIDTIVASRQIDFLNQEGLLSIFITTQLQHSKHGKLELYDIISQENKTNNVNLLIASSQLS